MQTMTRSSELQRRGFSKDSHERKRFHNQRAKWAHGTRPLAGQTEFSQDGRCRPAPRDVEAGLRVIHPDNGKRRPMTRDRDISHAFDDAISTRHDDDDGPAVDMAEKRALDHSGGLENSPNLFYSFDARRSPGQGDDILSVALARALERFDAKETDRLVREYELVSESEGSDAGGVGYHSDQDEDYEFVDHSQP